jgi:hypothetical protein
MYHYYSEFIKEFWAGDESPNSEDADNLLRYGAGSGAPDFIDWFRQQVLSTLGPSSFKISSLPYM